MYSRRSAEMIDVFSEKVPVRDADGDGKYRVSMRFDETFTGFKGHFPGRPVLPGVCQILAFSVFACNASGLKLALREITKAKFLSVVEPGETACFSFSLARNEGFVSLSGETSVEGKGVVGKFRLLFGVSDG